MREQYHRSRALRTREQGVHIPHPGQHPDDSDTVRKRQVKKVSLALKKEDCKDLVHPTGGLQWPTRRSKSHISLSNVSKKHLIIDRGEAVNELKDEGKLLFGVG